MVEWYGPSNTVLVVGTSHIARVANDLHNRGMDVLAIRGGVLGEIIHHINREARFPCKPKYVIIMAGGNDIQKLHRGVGRELANAGRVAEDLEGLVRVCEQKFRPNYCVTGTILPRMMGKTGDYGDRCYFIDQLEDVDHLIRKVGDGHRHYLTDGFVSDRCMDKRPMGAGGPHKQGIRLGLPELDLFLKDKVHLNNAGNERLMELFNWVMDSLTFEHFAEKRALGRHKSGSMVWKF